MSSNQVDIDISANDQASEVVQNLIGNFINLGNVANVVMGNLAAAAIFTGLNAVNDTVQNIKQGLLEAAAIQTQFISAANSTSLNLKINLPDAEALQKQLGKSISIAAASQPGTNSDYVEIANMISGSIARAYEGKPKEFLDATSELVKGAGVLANSAGIDPTNAGSVMGRFLNGTSSFKQLRNIDFFEKNQDLVFKIEEIAQAKGLQTKDLQNWTQRQRVEILTAATTAVVTPEFLARLNDTAEAKLQTMQANLFDPQIGLFGFLREIPSLGNLTVLDTFNNLLTTIDQFGQAIGRLSDSLGISVDPMKVLADFINFINETLLRLTVFTDGLATNRKGGIDGQKLDLGAIFGGMFEGIAAIFKDGNLGSMAAEALNKGISWLLDGLMNMDGMAIGKAIGAMATSLVKNISNFITQINWVEVLGIIAEASFRIIGAIAGIIISFDWNLIPMFFVDLIVNLLKNIFRAAAKDVAKTTNVVGNFLGNIFNAIGSSLKNAWDGLINALKGVFSGIVTKLYSIIPEPLRNVGQTFNQAGQVIGGTVGRIGEVGGAAINKVGSIFSPKPKENLKDKPKEELTIQPVPLPQPKPEPKSVAFAPTINVHPSPGMDESSLADRVLQQLASNYSSFKQGALA